MSIGMAADDNSLQLEQSPGIKQVESFQQILVERIDFQRWHTVVTPDVLPIMPSGAASRPLKRSPTDPRQLSTLRPGSALSCSDGRAGRLAAGTDRTGPAFASGSPEDDTFQSRRYV